MQHGFRIYIAILLASVLVFGGQNLRVMQDSVGQIVLCTGTGPVAVYVDADGQPVDPPHHDSLDCTPLALGLEGAPVDMPPLVVPTSATLTGSFIALAPVLWAMPALARGPPTIA